MEEYLTPQMVASKLHLGMTQVYKLFKLPGFPAVKLGGKWIVSAEKMKTFLSESEGTEINI